MSTSTRTADRAEVAAATEAMLLSWARVQDLQVRIPVEVEERFGIPPHRLHVLGAVQRGATRVQDIAAASFTSVSAASRTVDGLVREGWLDRRADPDDRRATRVTLTAEGEQHLGEVRAWAEGMIAGIVAELGPRRAERMADDLTAFATGVAAALDREAD